MSACSPTAHSDATDLIFMKFSLLDTLPNLRGTCSRRAAWCLLSLSALLTTVAAQPVDVQTARLDTVWQFPQRTAPAQVVARNESRLSAEVSGTVLRWTADVGTTVRRGDVLVQIDPKDYELALQRAEASLAAAQSRLQLSEVQLERARTLVHQGFFSREALTQRETELALLQAEVRGAGLHRDSARRQLGKTTVRAPFNGTVVKRTVQLGESVNPGTSLLTLAETTASEVQASLPPPEVEGLRQATTATFQLPGRADGWPLRLLRVSATVEPGSRTQVIRLGWATGAALPPGSSGVLTWAEPTPHVPVSLVVRRGHELGIFLRDGGVVRFVPLPDAQEGRAARTTLPGDSLIVVRGQAALNDGQRID